MSLPSGAIQGGADLWMGGDCWGPYQSLWCGGLGASPPPLPADDGIGVGGWWCFWETDHFFEAPGHKNCSPAHLVTHERGLGEKESNDDEMGILHAYTG